MKLPPEQSRAIEAVEVACRITEFVRETLSSDDARTKHDASPVTVADLAAQAVVTHQLGDSAPLVAEEGTDLLRADHVLLARVTKAVRTELPGISETEVLRLVEVGSADPSPKGRFWTLDPVDGTKGFLRGDQYAIALALIEDGRPVFGVLGCPALQGGLVGYAVLGGGAWVRKLGGNELTRLQVSPETDPAKWRCAEPVESAHSGLISAKRVLTAMGVGGAPIAMDSQAKYLLVAKGDAELYLRMPRDEVYRENIWDHAAGSLLVQEAGGVVSDIHGVSLDFSQGRKLIANQGIVAASPAAHAAAVRAISVL